MGEKNTTDVLFKRDTLENINNTPLKDGQVLWTIDQEGNDKIYNDIKQSDGTIKRTQIGGTIQVDQNFDKKSPYPLANKKIVDGLKDFIPAYAYSNTILRSALLVNLDDNYELNKAHPVYSSVTTDLPEDCLYGIREVARGKTGSVVVKIFGIDIYGVPAEWLNSYYDSKWNGWARVFTSKNEFVGFDEVINGVQKSSKLFPPRLETELEVAGMIQRNNITQASINYNGDAFVRSLSIQTDPSSSTSKTIIDSNRNIICNQIFVGDSYLVDNQNAAGKNSFTIATPGEDKRLNLYGGDSVRISANLASGITLWNDDAGGVIAPDIPNVVKLGTSTQSWEEIYCAGTIYYGTLSQVSDKKEKTHIAYLKDENKLDEFYMNLKPVEYKWKNDGHRTHLGFYAQDIAENAKNTIGDLSMYQARQIELDEKGKEIEKPYSADIADEDLKWTLSYDELIAPTVAMVQKQQKEIEKLKQQIENLKR